MAANGGGRPAFFFIYIFPLFLFFVWRGKNLTSCQLLKKERKTTRVKSIFPPFPLISSARDSKKKKEKRIIVWVTSSSSFWNSALFVCVRTLVGAYDVRSRWMEGGGMTTCSRELGGKRFMPRWQFRQQRTSRQKEKERRSLAHFGWSFVCACGSIDDGDNKRADVSPRGLLCFPFSSFVGSFLFCFRPRSFIFLFCRAGQT